MGTVDGAKDKGMTSVNWNSKSANLVGEKVLEMIGKKPL
jgi:hypothetical protein